MTEDLTRHEALRILALSDDAGPDAVKQAYRRLARAVHPDTGGDTEAFRDLQRAYERLLDTPAVARERRRTAHRAQPSRSQRAGHPPTQVWSDEAVDPCAIDWDATVTGRGPVPLDVHVVARSLARDHEGPVHPLTARSRGPRSPMNRWVHLADDFGAVLHVGPATERGRRGHDVELRVRANARKGRRTLETGELPADWVLTRGSSSTTALSVLPPSTEGRVTAQRAATALSEGLDRLGWPLAAWYAPADDLA